MSNKTVVSQFTKITTGLYVFAAFTFCVVFCAWLSSRSLPFSDEAYYVLLAAWPDSLVGSVGVPQTLASWIWAINPELRFFRLCGLILLVSSAVVFGFHSLKSLTKGSARRHEALIAGVISAIIACLYGSVINFSPSYNLFAVAGCLLSTALFLWSENFNERHQILARCLVVGILMGFVFLCKPPAGVSMIASLSFLTLSNKKSEHRVSRIAALFLGCIGTTFVVALIIGVNSFIQLQITGRDLYSSAVPRTLRDLLIDHATSIVRLPIDLVFEYPLTLICLVVFLLSRTAVVTQLVQTALVVTLGLEIYLGEAFLGGSSRFDLQILPFAILTLVCIVGILKSRDLQLQARTMCLILLTPFIGAFGTGNRLTTNAILGLSPWVVVATFFLWNSIRTKVSMFFSFALVAIFCTVSISQLITASTRDPYQLPDTAGKNRIEYKLRDLGKLYLDPRTIDYVEAAYRARDHCEWASSTLSIAVYHNPGIALLLDTNPVGSPWFTNVLQLRIVIEKRRLTSKDGLVVALRREFDGSLPPIKGEIPGWPNNFRYCGKAIYPFATQENLIFYRAPIPENADK